ncbi:unnamed protein product [Owenia fusiformis]|uniref:Protein inturned n=1 Tax=Owenia fusiformis TaxID=6347 RepID=A0A8J1TIB1_OWEFU|nr:unnamed protein product [Owenia fusiformis]
MPELSTGHLYNNIDYDRETITDKTLTESEFDDYGSTLVDGTDEVVYSNLETGLYGLKGTAYATQAALQDFDSISLIVKYSQTNGKIYYDERGAYNDDRNDSESSGSFYSDDESDGLEPVWADKVDSKGELFYLEAPHHNDPAPYLNNNNLAQSNNHLTESDKLKKKTGLDKLKNLIGKNKIEKGSADVLNNQIFNNIGPTGKPNNSVKDVLVYADPYREIRGVSLCEALFGIIPGQFVLRSSHPARPTPQLKILVQGLVPGGEAMRSGQIKIGDWLMYVNDLEVNWHNVDSILSAITSPKQVKLTLQKSSAVTTSTGERQGAQLGQGDNEMVKLVSGEQTEIATCSSPHQVMYLTLESNSETAKDQDDLMYVYPRQTDSKLVEIRGMFLTISHMLPDVTKKAAKNSTVMCNEELVHVGYAQEGKELLVIALPADRVDLYEMDQVIAITVRAMRVLYGSLSSAFGNKENSGRLDHYFCLLFHKLLTKSQQSSNQGNSSNQHSNSNHSNNVRMLELLPSVQFVPLAEELKVEVDNILSDFESADFVDMSDDYYDVRRLYSILGSSLYYKGCLVSSHLHSVDLEDVGIYLQCYSILDISSTNSMGQLVLWKEVFPTRRCHKQVDPLLPGYTEPEGRWFLLVVGLQNYVLATLLEAAGCAQICEGQPSPDPFFVDQARATLLQMLSSNVHSQCQARISNPAGPHTTSADQSFPCKTSKHESPRPKGSPRVAHTPRAPQTQIHHSPRGMPGSQSMPMLKKPSPLPERHKNIVRSMVFEDHSDPETQSTGSNMSTPTSHRKPSQTSDDSGGSGGSSGLFKSQKKQRKMAPYDVSGLKQSLDFADNSQNAKLTVGDCNLFHYLCLDWCDGVYICPGQTERGPNHKQLLRNFYVNATRIHNLFQHSINAHNGGSHDECLGGVTEQGVLFECTPDNWPANKKQPPVLQYWIIGRLFLEPQVREVYVCHQDGAAQNIVELAFKLGFGTCS